MQRSAIAATLRLSASILGLSLASASSGLLDAQNAEIATVQNLVYKSRTNQAVKHGSDASAAETSAILHSSSQKYWWEDGRHNDIYECNMTYGTPSRLVDLTHHTTARACARDCRSLLFPCPQACCTYACACKASDCTHRCTCGIDIDAAGPDVFAVS